MFVGGGPRLLVVEDEGSVRRLLEKFLRGLGYVVDAARGLEEAWGLVNERAYLLAIADLDLSSKEVGSTWELIAELRRRQPRVRVVVQTALEAPVSPEAARQRGADALLIKPWSLRELEETVMGLLDDTRPPG